MIVSGGFNIWPAELEHVISALPGVREVVVFGVPDDKWGETPLAEVILDDGAALDDATVIAACVAQLGSYKKPGQVVFRTEPFPRSPVGKLQRKVIREPYWAGQTAGWPVLGTRAGAYLSGSSSRKPPADASARRSCWRMVCGPAVPRFRVAGSRGTGATR